MQNILTLGNDIQVVLWNEEIAGQLSDGMWEDTDPTDHWEAWCDAVAVVGPEIGRDFDVYRDDYDLVDLVELLGPRMIEYVKDELGIEISTDRLVDELTWIERAMRRGSEPLPWSYDDEAEYFI